MSQELKRVKINGTVGANVVAPGDVVGDPKRAWVQSTAEEYIDSEIEKVKNWVSNTPVTNVVTVSSLPASGNVNTLYRVAGTNTYSEYGWDGTAFIKLDEKEYGIDDEPTAGSDNLVKSGGIYNNTLGGKLYNLYDNRLNIENRFIDNYGNVLAHEGSKISPLIPVKPNTIYAYSIIGMTADSNCYGRFVGANKTTALHALNPNDNTEIAYNAFKPSMLVKSPANAAFVQFAVKIDNKDTSNNVQFIEASTLPSIYYPFGKYIDYSDSIAKEDVDVVMLSNGTIYNSLSEVIPLIPNAQRRGNVVVSYLQLKPALYLVIKQEGLTTELSGTEVNEPLSIGNGAYKESELSEVPTLPTLRNTVVYYIDNGDSTYTSWSITKAFNDFGEKVCYKLNSASWNTYTTYWSRIDDSILRMSVLEDSKVTKQRNGNLFNKNDNRIISGQYVDSTGYRSAYGYCVTHPIYLEGGRVVKTYLPGSAYGETVAFICNDDGTIYLQKAMTTVMSYVIPKNGYYRFNYLDSRKSTFMVCYDEYPSTYIPFQNAEIENNVEFSESQKEYIAQITQAKADAVIEVEKNLFDKSKAIAHYYLYDSNGSLLYNSSDGYYITNKIPVEEGKIYHKQRPNLAQTSAVRFLDENDNILTPIFPDGQGYTPFVPATGKNASVQAPVGAKYFQCTVVFNNQGSLDNTQFELGSSFTGYEPYTEKKVLPYEELPKQLLDEINQEASEGTKIINIANSDKIGVFSTSYMNGYCMKNHHHLNNLSMFLDYIFYNYGKSGDNELTNLARLESDSTWLGVVPPSQWNIRYGIIMHDDNSQGLKAANADTAYENSKKLANAVKSLGGIPIFSTEHDIDFAYYQGIIRLCNEEGYMFMNWGTKARKLFNTVFAPFWYNSHPSTRTGWMISYGMLPYLQSLPRPMQCVKLFRVRSGVDTTNLQNLVFEDFYSRAERFIELTCGVSALTSATAKYFDRLDATGKSFADVNDEYQNLQNGTAVTFGNFALINAVLPYNKTGLQSLILYLTQTGVTNVYVQKVREISNPLPTGTNISFAISEGASEVSVGDTFTVTGGVHNDNLLGTYTVGDIVNGLLVTTTSGANKTTSGTDTPTITSSDFDVALVSLGGSSKYPSLEYMARYDKPLGEWVEVTTTTEDGGFDLSDFIGTCLNLDSIAILLKGSNISISDLYLKAQGTKLKTEHSIPMTKFKKGITALTDNLFGDSTSWSGVSTLPTFDNTTIASTVNPSSYEALPPGITTVKILSEGVSTRQNLIQSVLVSQNTYEPVKLQCRVVARYFPKYIDTDAKWETSDVNEQSFDVARLAISLGVSNTDSNPMKIAKLNVGAYWNEFIFDTYVASSGAYYIKLECTDKEIQIAKVELEAIE